MGVPVVPALLPERIWGCFHCFFFSVFLWDVVILAVCQWGVHAGPKVPRVFLHSRGETEALGLMGAGLGVCLIPFSVPSGFLWLCCFW